MLWSFQLLLWALPLVDAIKIPSVLFGPKLEVPDRPQLVQDAMTNKRPIYYFGVGSNLSREKVENRGINGTKIHCQSFQTFGSCYRAVFSRSGCGYPIKREYSYNRQFKWRSKAALEALEALAGEGIRSLVRW